MEISHGFTDKQTTQIKENISGRVSFKLRQMARFHQLTPRSLQSQIANDLSTLRHQHKNKTPISGV